MQYIKKLSKDKWVGLKLRANKEYNYRALWHNLKTYRFDEGDVMELPLGYSEFYDVSLGPVCRTGRCSFCYVSANPDAKHYENVCETWRKWMDTYTDTLTEDGICLTSKPFQIAIGSEGEPLEHMMICEFLKTVYETNVVPNYTTNGVILASWNKPDSIYYEKANEILTATSKYVGGVAVSLGNKALRKYAFDAIDGLFEKGNCHVMTHHLISDKESVDDFLEIRKKYGSKIHNYVLLPLMAHGRSEKGIEDGVFEYLEKVIEENNIKDVAFGAHFIKYLEKSDKVKTYLYPAESYSKNILLKDGQVVITPSSYDLNPIKIIDLK